MNDMLARLALTKKRTAITYRTLGGDWQLLSYLRLGSKKTFNKKTTTSHFQPTVPPCIRKFSRKPASTRKNSKQIKKEPAISARGSHPSF